MRHVLIAWDNELIEYFNTGDKHIKMCVILRDTINRMLLSSAYAEYCADRLDDNPTLSSEESKKFLIDFLETMVNLQ